MSKNSNSNCVVVGRQFCVPYRVNLTIFKKLTGNYSIVDEDGDIVFKVKPTLSIRQRHILYDDSGNPLLSMQTKITSTPDTWNVFRGDSDDPRHLLFTVEKTTGSDSDLQVSITGDERRFTIKKSWLGGSYKIYNGVNVIAAMQRKFRVQSLFFGMDNLAVNVNANVDYAFIVALVIMLNTMVSGVKKQAAQTMR